MPRVRVKNMSAEELVNEIDNLNNRKKNIHEELVIKSKLKHEFHSPIMNTIYAEITPRTATLLLDKFNTNTGVDATNRRESKGGAHKISLDMRAGHFHGNVSTIVFDNEGMLMDGQTRLAAIVQSKKPCNMHVLMGVEREGMLKIDIGRKRTNADRFRLAGLFGKVSNVAAKKIELWSRMSISAGRPDGSRNRRPFGRGKSVITDDIIVEESERLHEPIAYILKNQPSIKELQWFPLLIAVAQWWVENDSAGVSQAEEAKQFYDQISSGLNLIEGDPIYVLREKFIETDFNSTPYGCFSSAQKWALAYGWTIFTINKHTNALPMKKLSKRSTSYELELL